MKTKKDVLFCCVLFILMFFCTVFAVNAGDFEIDNDGVLVNYTGPGGDVVIPAGVTSIGDNAFDNCSSLVSITIPDSVTSIGRAAFESCDNLVSVTIPDCVTSIGDWAFNNCSSLVGITIPENVTSIGNRTFSGCNSLESITIPDSVTSIGDYAFYNCFSLVSITIPDSVTSIGKETFAACKSLEIITIPDSVTSIGDYAFSACISLVSVTISDSVTIIEKDTFANCLNLMSITFPSNVRYISNGALRGCSSLVKITIPEGAVIYGDGSTVLPESTWDLEKNGNWFSIHDKEWYSTYSIGQYRDGIADTYYAFDPFNTPKTTGITITDSEGTKINGNSIPCYQEEYQLSASASPEEALQRFFWESNDRDIAEVDRDGKVTIKKREGSVRITVTAVDDSDESAWVELILQPKAEAIAIHNATGANITGQEINIPDQTYQLCVKITPEDALQKVIWFRDDMIASVSSDGLVTFNSYGSITFTARTTDGSNLSASVKLIYGPPEETVVHILNSAGTDITGKAVSINEPGYQLQVTVTPAAGAPNFTWGSSDNTTAIVDSSGMVSFKKAGTVTITAIALDGSGKSAAVTLNYVANDTTLMLPLDLTDIRSSAFEGSNSFSAVILPDGLETIGDRAFADCSNLLLVYIPSSVTYIANDAFPWNSGLNFVCQSENSAGADYARSHNIWYRIGY